jgi:hypothetical protein
LSRRRPALLAQQRLWVRLSTLMFARVVVKIVVRWYHERFAFEDYEASDEKTQSALFASV